MVEGPDNTTGKWQQLKARFLALTFRAQAFIAIGVVALIAVIVVTATTVIDVGNPDAVPGVTIRFEPANLQRTPGQTLSVQLVVDTQGRPVSAVQAVFDIDASRLNPSCTSATNCPDITVNPTWGTIAELSRVGNTITIAVGASTPANGTGVPVATINFPIPVTAPFGDATADFNDPSLSAVIENDGQGTNIIDTVQSEEWEIVESLPTGSILITSGPYSSVNPCGPPGQPAVNISWNTNEPGDSQIALSQTPCPTCAYSQFYSTAEYTDYAIGPTDNHEFTINGLPGDTVYYYRVRSVSSITNDEITSEERYFYTGCGSPTLDPLVISNLTVTPSARLALVTWNTNLLADTEITSLSPPNNQNNSTFFDPTVTLSHSITIPSLEPATNYCIDVRSTTPAPGNEEATASTCFDTESEDLTLDSNIVLKVERDRICDQWLSCASSVEVEDVQGESRDLCFDYALCEELDVENNGECTKMISAFTLGGGSAMQYDIVAQSAISSSIEQSSNLTGYSKVGANWRGLCSDNQNICVSDADCGNNDCVGVGPGEGFPIGGSVTGFFPVPKMVQVGSSAGIPNGDFEAGFAYPWQPRRNLPDDQKTIIQTIVDRTVLAADFNNILSVRPTIPSTGQEWSGTLIPLGNSLQLGTPADPTQYYVSFDVRRDDTDYDTMRVEFGYSCSISGSQYYYSPGNVSQDVIDLSNGWQRVMAGPLEFGASNQPPANNEEVCLAFLVNAPGNDNGAFYLDNVQVHPVLQAKPGDVSPESHITRTCRQYPTEDTPTCQYFDVNTGRQLQGWEGYCLQTDPRNERRCIQWVPIDLIAGASPALAAYGQAGYGTSPEDRVPLYYCTEARGNAPYIRNAYVGPEVDWDGHEVPFILFTANHESFPRFGWGTNSGVIKFDDISYPPTGQAFTAGPGPTYNPKPLYIYDVERIAIDFTGREAGDWPLGITYLDRANGFEWAWCHGHESCPNYQAEYKDPDSSWHWKKIVDTIDHCNALNNNKINLMGIQAVFADDEGKDPNCTEANCPVVGPPGAFLWILSGLCDGSDKDGWVAASPVIYLREWCTEIAQVVDPFGSNTAWAERIHNNLYEVPGLGYQRDRDLMPFGGIVVPDPDYDPSKWDYSSQEKDRQPMMIEPADTQNFPQSPHQARASSPYGGAPDPSNKACDYYRVGRAICVSGDRIGEDCATNADCGYGSDNKLGRCTGVVPPGLVDEDDFFSALECPELQTPPLDPNLAANLFARSEAVWQWNTTARSYLQVSNADEGWDIAGETTPNPPYNPVYAKPPRVENLTIKAGRGGGLNLDLNGGDWLIFDQNYGKVTVTFNSVVDPEQAPLTRYTVDWGDGSTSEESNLKIAPQSTLPHVLTHTYTIPLDPTNDPNCVPAERFCVYQPRVQIEDNWNWCSGNAAQGNYSGGGTACGSWDYVKSGTHTHTNVRLNY